MYRTAQTILAAVLGRTQLLLVAIVLCAFAANAAQINLNCTAINNLTPPPSGTANAACAGFTGANAVPGGATINYVKMVYTVDFTYNPYDPGTASVTFAFDAPGTGFDVNNIVSTLGNRPVTGQVQVNGPASITGLTSAFNVAGSWTANVPPITAVSMGVRFTVDYTPASTVPEPATLGFVGIALVGLGIRFRRRS